MVWINSETGCHRSSRSHPPGFAEARLRAMLFTKFGIRDAAVFA
jgi:hypothetical protein